VTGDASRHAARGRAYYGILFCRNDYQFD